MIRNGNHTSTLEYDICIVGAGAAGISLCTSLAYSGLRIAVLESGTFEKTLAADEHRVLESVGIPIRESSRERVVGGTTSTWGGLSSLLDPIDFERRKYLLEHEGWPFDERTLQPYLKHAAQLRFPRPEAFEPESFLSAAQTQAFPWKGFDPKVFLAVRPPVRFGQEYLNVFRKHGVDLWIDSTVTKLVRDEAGAISSVCISQSDGTQSELRARVFVLAAGALENVRLLLVSDVGNDHDQVGRYIMNHPKGFVGRITLKRSLEHAGAYFLQKTGSYSGYIGLRLSDDEQRNRHLLNGYIKFEPGHPWTGDPYAAVAKESLDAIKCFVRERDIHILKMLLRLIPRLVRGTPRLCAFALHRLFVRHPTHLLPRYFLEMEPRGENCVRLSQEIDACGVRRLHVKHCLGERDIASFRALRERLRQECVRLGLGEYHFDQEALPGEDASHHLGGARMGFDPRTSVVDANLRVHGVENLYVAGGAVFPTSGNANPTLTMVALSLRLADHLREHFRVQTSVSEDVFGTLPTLLIGAGKRVVSDIMPALESLPEYHIAGVYARSPRMLFGARRTYAVRALEEIRIADIAAAKVLYLSLPPQEVQPVLAQLERFDCTHITLILPTPVHHEVHSDMFAQVFVEEDMVFLPWLSALPRTAEDTSRRLILDRSAYRYHALALIKTILGRVRWGVRLGRSSYIWCTEGRALLKEPRDYATGRLHFKQKSTIVTDRPGSDAIAIELLTEGRRCTGFRIGGDIEQLSPEESELFGPTREGDTIVTRMHDCKRVGLRRLLHAAAAGQGRGVGEGQHDVHVVTSLRRFGVYLGKFVP